VIAFSGVQYELTFADQRAVVTEVGATLRRYDMGSSPITTSFGEDEVARAGTGQVLAPFPNRLRDGLYEFDGIVCKVPWDEPSKSNAIHGLVRWAPWELVHKDTASVRLHHRMLPQPAYPFDLDLEVEYLLGPEGLVVTLGATACGDRRAPFGAGFHPYIALDAALADQARVAMPVDTRLLLDERSLPIGQEAVAGTPFAVACGSSAVEQEPIGALRLDDCFTGVTSDPDGRWRTEVLPGGRDRPVVIWADAIYSYIMCFTADTLAAPYRRKMIAVEPMTCPPDAFRSGTDLIVLEPGESFSAKWGITP
jgi:aldose 1-epimerase